MIYELKETEKAGKAEYKTTVDISENDGILTFSFECEHTKCFCPFEGKYNELHCDGDVCEIFIGSDPTRNTYYEMELSPKGDLMLAKMRYNGDDEQGIPILDLDYVADNFVKTSASLTENGYKCSMTFAIKDILTGEGDVFFNCYRIETDGGTPNRHLFALNPTMRRRFHTPQYYVNLKDYI